MASTLTVITPAASQNLTTLETVKAEAGIADSDTSKDALYSTWIEQASGVIAEMCNRVFGMESVREQFRLRSVQERLILSRYPVDTITSVTENDVELTADDYEVDPESGIMTRLVSDLPTCWPCGKIVVVYDAGYELLDGVPWMLERAVIDMVRTTQSRSSRDPLLKTVDLPEIGRRDFWVGSASGSQNDGGLPASALAAISKYRRRVTG